MNFAATFSMSRGFSWDLLRAGLLMKRGIVYLTNEYNMSASPATSDDWYGLLKYRLLASGFFRYAQMKRHLYQKVILKLMKIAYPISSGPLPERKTS